jgi:hypothetical protein
LRISEVPTPFHHPYRVDTPTVLQAQSLPGYARLRPSVQLPESVRFLSIDPLVFTHAYLLLGENPQRFTNDLSPYLATVRMFFERADATGGIAIPADANTDFRRRVSEDLGVALASVFMVDVFGLTWDSISQIPANTQLSKKRPDFQGFAHGARRYLFEAKGTTKLTGVEKCLSKALTQVKGYPEQAQAKIAIVSFLSADERFFPSTSFVVDPPALPSSVPPDITTSIQLHFEKVLQFAGQPETAKTYIREVAAELRERKRAEDRGEAPLPEFLIPPVLRAEVRAQSGAERQRVRLTPHRAFDIDFAVRELNLEAIGMKLLIGVARDVLENGISAGRPPPSLSLRTETNDGGATSIFPDGTLIRVDVG